MLVILSQSAYLEASLQMRYFVISDPHGFYSILHSTLQEKGFFADSHPHKLLILGDLMDRGKQALQMQDFILDLLIRDEIILIRGNHEDLFEEFLLDDEGCPDVYSIQNGTYDTALQLTGFSKRKVKIHRRVFVQKALETPFYQIILPAMRDYYETEHYIFVHGWIPCVFEGRTCCYSDNWRDADTNEWHDARWVNGMVAAQTATCEKTVVCGHWSASYGHSKIEGRCTEFGPDADFSPYYGKNVIGIDACTGYSGTINCLIIDD